MLAVIRGTIRFRLITDPRGFDAIDDYDCRDWLRLNGASERSVDSAFVRALYDLAFAYEDGDVSRPRIAAGALRGRSARSSPTGARSSGRCRPGWATSCSPRSTRCSRSAACASSSSTASRTSAWPTAAGDRPYVEALDFDVQARRVTGGVPAPVDVRGLPCWPAEPDWASSSTATMKRERRDFESHWDPRASGRRRSRRRRLRFRRSRVGIGAVPHVCTELMARDDAGGRWSSTSSPCRRRPFSLDVRRHEQLGWKQVRSTLGLRRAVRHLGRHDPSRPEESHRGRPRRSPTSAACLPDAPPEDREPQAYPAERHDEVQGNAIRFLNRDIVHLWPGGPTPRRFRWDLVDRPGGRDPRRSGEAASTGSTGAPTSTRPIATPCRFPARSATGSRRSTAPTTTWPSPATGPTAGSTKDASRRRSCRGGSRPRHLGVAAARGNRRFRPPVKEPSDMSDRRRAKRRPDLDARARSAASMASSAPRRREAPDRGENGAGAGPPRRRPRREGGRPRAIG